MLRYAHQLPALIEIKRSVHKISRTRRGIKNRCQRREENKSAKSKMCRKVQDTLKHVKFFALVNRILKNIFFLFFTDVGVDFCYVEVIALYALTVSILSVSTVHRNKNDYLCFVSADTNRTISQLITQSKSIATHYVLLSPFY